ncbi:hypothetical protein DFH27DRAFT_117437 [Peziza echinospora]|nr:hypothetical protein DFH27DRAFT_117437 [Peziza echinospora]
MRSLSVPNEAPESLHTRQDSRHTTPRQRQDVSGASPFRPCGSGIMYNPNTTEPTRGYHERAKDAAKEVGLKGPSVRANGVVRHHQLSGGLICWQCILEMAPTRLTIHICENSQATSHAWIPQVGFTYGFLKIQKRQPVLVKPALVHSQESLYTSIFPSHLNFIFLSLHLPSYLFSSRSRAAFNHMQSYVISNRRRSPVVSSGHRSLEMCWLSDDDSDNKQRRSARLQVQRNTSLVPYEPTRGRTHRSPERFDSHNRGRSVSITRISRASSTSRARAVINPPTIVHIEERTTHLDRSKHKHSNRRRHHRRHRHHSSDGKRVDISYHSNKYTSIGCENSRTSYGQYIYDPQPIRIAHATPPPESPYASTAYSQPVSGYHLVPTTGPGEEIRNQSRASSRNRHFVASASLSTGHGSHFSMRGAAHIHDADAAIPIVQPQLIHEEVYIAQPSTHHEHHHYSTGPSNVGSSEYTPPMRYTGTEHLRVDGRGHIGFKMRYGEEYPYRPRSPMRMRRPRAPSPRRSGSEASSENDTSDDSDSGSSDDGSSSSGRRRRTHSRHGHLRGILKT